MRSTFNIKEPIKIGFTYTIFSLFQARRTILQVKSPKDWNFKNREPNNLSGSDEAHKQRVIKRQL